MFFELLAESDATAPPLPTHEFDTSLKAAQLQMNREIPAPPSARGGAQVGLTGSFRQIVALCQKGEEETDGKRREWYGWRLNEEIQVSRAGATARAVMTDAEAPVAVDEPSLEPRKRPNRSDKRRTLLTEEPLTLGSSWARVWCQSMQTDGRLVVGGWPGTLAEARARVQGHLGNELARRRMPSLSVAELSEATSATYQRAKRDWLLAARDMRPKGARHSEDDEDDE